MDYFSLKIDHAPPTGSLNKSLAPVLFSSRSPGSAALSLQHWYFSTWARRAASPRATATDVLPDFAHCVLHLGYAWGIFGQQFGCQSQGSELTSAEVQLQSSLKPLTIVSDINIPPFPQQWVFFHLLEQGAFSLPDGSRLYVLQICSSDEFSKLTRITSFKSVAFSLSLGEVWRQQLHSKISYTTYIFCCMCHWGFMKEGVISLSLFTYWKILSAWWKQFGLKYLNWATLLTENKFYIRHRIVPTLFLGQEWRTMGSSGI